MHAFGLHVVIICSPRSSSVHECEAWYKHRFEFCCDYCSRDNFNLLKTFWQDQFDTPMLTTIITRNSMHHITPPFPCPMSLNLRFKLGNENFNRIRDLVFQLKVNRTSSSGLKLDRIYDWADKHKPDNKDDPLYFDVVSLVHE